jgi:Uma2 family endonuclease
MAIAQHRLTHQDYEAFVLSGIDGQWELHDGILVEKPAMTLAHMDVISRLCFHLQRQLDVEQFSVYSEGRVRQPEASVFLPDVMVVPDAYRAEFLDRPDMLAVFAGPLPLVVEVWSRSTGHYDVAAKLPIYQQRGDAEIWLIHPYEKMVTSWRRQPDGTYLSSTHDEGTVRPVALPGVVIDIAELFL